MMKPTKALLSFLISLLLLLNGSFGFMVVHVQTPAASAAATTLLPKSTTRTCLFGASRFQASFWDKLFLPFHGHGSGEHHLLEIQRTETEVLKDRQKHYTKDQLKKKYSQIHVDHLRDIRTLDHDNPAALNRKEDEAMYFDDNNKNKKNENKKDENHHEYKPLFPFIQKQTHKIRKQIMF